MTETWIEVDWVTVEHHPKQTKGRIQRNQVFKVIRSKAEKWQWAILEKHPDDFEDYGTKIFWFL